MHKNCQTIFLEHCRHFFKDGMRVLEAGPNLSGSWYRKQLHNRDAVEWTTVDVREDRSATGRLHDVDLTGTCYSYPVTTGEFDIVFAAMVIEHVPQPWTWMQELARCVKKGGRVIVIAPFVGKEHGDWSVPIDAATIPDCFRFLPQGLEELATFADLATEKAAIMDVEPDDYHVDCLLVARKE